MSARSGGTSSGAWVLFALAVLGVAATGLAVERARADAVERDTRAVDLARERVAAGLLVTASSLHGADVLAADGEVTNTEFAAFAGDIVPDSEFTSLAYAELVDGAEREAWEGRTGQPIVDSDGGGGFVTSPDRAQHVVVRFVTPETASSLRVVGLDFLGDPLRSRAVAEATTADRSVVVGPSRLASNGNLGLFVINAVRDGEGEVVGFVAGGISVDTVIEPGKAVSNLVGLGLAMDGETLVQAEGSARSSFEIGGRSFVVGGQDRRDASWTLPAVVLLGTLTLFVGALITGRRQRRDREHQRWVSLRNTRLAELAEALAMAATTADVVGITLQSAGGVVGATHTSLGRRDPLDPTQLAVAHDDRLAPDIADRYQRQSLDAGLPLTDCLATSAPVVLPTRSAHRQHYPNAADDVEQAGVHSVICVPLSLGSEQSAAAIGFGWTTPIEPDRLDDVLSTTQSVAQLVGRGLERTRVRELVQSRVDMIGELSRALAVARTREDIADAVADLLPPLLDVQQASLTTSTDQSDEPGSRRYALRDSADVVLQLIVTPGTPWNATYESLARGVVDLVDGAWSRAELYDHGASVLQQLQATLLSEPPRMEGFEVAAAYRSAIEAVGIGGDWYSVIEVDSLVHVVIGDIAGHGPGAVALMAETKTILRYLLSNGASILTAADRAGKALQRRRAYASAALVTIDRQRGRLTYVNAGHPPPLMVHDGCVTILDQGRGPWLGVEGGIHTTAEMEFPEGATLVLYTDGLLEERGEHIDVSIARLTGLLHGADRDVDALVQRLLRERADRRTDRSVDDDVALVAIRRLAH